MLEIVEGCFDKGQGQCRMACRLGLERLVVVGKCFLGAAVPPDGNIAAEVFEAVIGAVFVDGGYEAVKKVVQKSLSRTGGKGD
jgi:dsRNA-specific ribonuclease